MDIGDMSGGNWNIAGKPSSTHKAQARRAGQCRQVIVCEIRR